MSSVLELFNTDRWTEGRTTELFKALHKNSSVKKTKSFLWPLDATKWANVKLLRYVCTLIYWVPAFLFVSVEVQGMHFSAVHCTCREPRAERPVGWSSSPSRPKNFPFYMSRPTLVPTQPPIQSVLRAISPGVKRPGREADHSPPASAEIKKTLVYTSIPQTYVFTA
jgi:hypothetical protein